jgi:type IV pilus assembly protein PilW
MNSAATVPANSTLVISDCEYATVFATTSAFGGAATAEIPHAQETDAEPGNEVDTIRTNYPIDALIQPIDTVIYYVRESASGNGPALWQKVGAADPVELVQGVENLQFQYGIDTNGDLLVDTYVNADEVEGPPERWGNIVSISIAVLIRSEFETGVETDKRTYDLLGTPKGPFNDRRQRSVFITTVTLRNGAT